MVLHIQISDYDTYRLLPTPLDQLQGAQKVPIIRIYGALRVPTSPPSSYNVVVHLHNYYPSLYVDCPLLKGPYEANYLHELTVFLEDHLAESFRRKSEVVSDEDLDDDDFDQPSGTSVNGTATRRFITSIEYCRGTPAYGYHLGYRVVLKILFLLPHYKTRFTRLMAERKMDFARFAGTHRKKPLNRLNVYEAHINYFSQFLADYNLFGCSWLEAAKCHFRLPIINNNSLPIETLKKYLASHIAHNNILNSKRYPRMGKPMLEIDISVGDILNRSRLHERNIHDNFNEFNTLAPSSQIYLSSLQLTYDELMYQCTSRNNEKTSQLLHKLYSQVFKNIGKGGYCDWENSKHLKDLLLYVRKLNKETHIDDPNSYFSKIIVPGLPDSSIPTCFELVDKTASLSYFEKVPLLNYRDDLLRWKYYDQLFETNADVTSESVLGTDFQNAEGEHEKRELNEDPQRNAQESPVRPGSIVEASGKSNTKGLDNSDSELDSQPIGSDIPPPTDKAAESQVHYPGVDLHYLAMTQKNIQPTRSSLSSDSGSLILTQTLDYLVRNPKTIWENVIPVSLQKKRLERTMQETGLLNIDYADPFYSKKGDVHAQPLVFANRKIIVPYNGVDSLPIFVVAGTTHTLEGQVGDIIYDKGKRKEGSYLLQFAMEPPSKSTIRRGIVDLERMQIKRRKKFKSQIEPAVTLTHDYKYSLRPHHVDRNPSEFLKLTLMHMEIHVNTSGELLPNPRKDPVTMIIFHFDDANNMYSTGGGVTSILLNIEALLDKDLIIKQLRRISEQIKTEIRFCNTERETVYELVRKVDEYDPDILSGYEVNGSSWGYLIERFKEKFKDNLIPLLSRSLSFANGKFGDRWGYTHTSAIKINGRHMLNIWRLLKSELSLTSYTLELISFHVLHERLPKISNLDLSNLICQSTFAQRLIFFKYYNHRIYSIMRILDVQEFVLRNVEQSRLIGVDFYSNFYRGSQFKVESILLRIAKEENMLLDSPSKAQVHEMRALDVVPLIMEPDSNFYKSPLVVLDFQSLYPSIMIAYNYCYSTLIGKIEGFNPSSNEVGFMKHLGLPPGIIEMLEKNGGLNISPNGYMFVSSKFRKSVLAKMLEEILNMRINMRSVAAAFPEDVELSRLLNSKQLAMKLIANVTYGYTSASFSGRMPNSDIADAIVATGRELMTKSIEIIESSEYGAKVVYGDTDSLFVYFPGKSKEDAFKFGRSLAKKVTDYLPDPIKLKFEKVYHPCVLIAKKRYVGQCFELENQITPKFEAKGIETIRRDGIPAQLKMVGKTLRILFETKDLSKVKEYVLRQFHKILTNRVNVKDFCFAKAVRYGTYKNEQYLPPGAIVARNKMKKDPRSEPQYKERVPYLVIKDVTKERLKDRCYSPEDYIASYSTENPMQLDYDYYINKVLIPPLERVFNLMGVKVKEWYRDMLRDAKLLVQKKDDIVKSAYVRVKECFYCKKELDGDSDYLCKACLSLRVEVMTNIIQAWKEKEKQVMEYKYTCKECNYKSFGASMDTEIDTKCCNQDCEVYYAKFKSINECELLEQETRAVIIDDSSLQW